MCSVATSYERAQDGAKGWRNGYREGRLSTAEGEVRYSVPQLKRGRRRSPAPHQGVACGPHRSPGRPGRRDVCPRSFHWGHRGLLPGGRRPLLALPHRRGLPDPLLVATGGAPGLIRAVEECLPASLRQLGLAHKMRNILERVPERAQAEVKEAVRAAYQAPSVALSRVIKEEVVARYEKRFPAAVRSFLSGLRGLCGPSSLAPSPPPGVPHHQSPGAAVWGGAAPQPGSRHRAGWRAGGHETHVRRPHPRC